MNVVFNHRRIRSKEYLRSIFDSVGGEACRHRPAFPCSSASPQVYIWPTPPWKCWRVWRASLRIWPQLCTAILHTAVVMSQGDRKCTRWGNLRWFRADRKTSIMVAQGWARGTKRWPITQSINTPLKLKLTGVQEPSHRNICSRPCDSSVLAVCGPSAARAAV